MNNTAIPGPFASPDDVAAYDAAVEHYAERLAVGDYDLTWMWLRDEFIERLYSEHEGELYGCRLLGLIRGGSLREIKQLALAAARDVVVEHYDRIVSESAERVADEMVETQWL